MSRVKSSIARFVGISSTIAAFTGWWFRPIPNNLVEPLEANEMSQYSKNIKRNLQSKLYYPLTSTNSSSEHTGKPLPLLYSISRQIVIFIGVSITRSFLLLCGDFTIKHDENYCNFVRRVMELDQKEHAPLLTVSNHRSLLDEPSILSSILPYWLNIQPKFVRNSICSQEYCFNEKLGKVAHGIVGLGKVLPIIRGGGIDQPFLLDFARLLASGEWCHIFPEGGIWQEEFLGGRKDKPKDLGRLKWGVGKLIAHAPCRPVVIAFFASGMEHLIPQDPITKKVDSIVPRVGHKVRVRFSAEISFDDLIEEHEKRYGKLWKYSASVEDGASLRNQEMFTSTAQEKRLYSAITKRIEDVLHELNLESNEDTY